MCLEKDLEVQKEAVEENPFYLDRYDVWAEPVMDRNGPLDHRR